jgi:hypothetical protein
MTPTGQGGDKPNKQQTPKKGRPTPKAPKTPKARKPMPPGREARPPKEKRTDITLAPPGTGRRVVWASYAGTLVLAVSAIAADLSPHTFDFTAFVLALVLFFGGTAIFVWAYLVMAGRSRTDDLTLSGVFGLAGSAPSAVQRRLFGSLALEVIVSITTAATRVYSTLSFGVLASMWGLGLTGLWGARYGAFPPRPPQPPRPERRRKK